jgi:hypothetical protein
MDDHDTQIADAAANLKEVIAQAITTNYPKGVNALVLGYVGIDMVAQSTMSMFAQGDFATLEQGRDALFEAIELALNEYAQNAAITGDSGFPLQ